MFGMSPGNSNKALAGRDLLRMAMGGGGLSGSETPPPNGGAQAHANTMVRIHGIMDKPAPGGLFTSDDWKPMYFVLRADFILEYYAVPPAKAQPPHWRHGLVPYGSVVEHLGQARGSYPLQELGIRSCRAEGPRLHIYLSRDVRFGGKQVRDLQLRASAADRGQGVPHATAVIQHWAQAVQELMDQMQRGTLPSAAPPAGGFRGSPGGPGFSPQGGSPGGPGAWGQSPMGSNSSFGGASPQQSQQQQQWSSGQQWGSMPPQLPHDSSKNSWNSGRGEGAPPPLPHNPSWQSSPGGGPAPSQYSRSSFYSEADQRRMEELQDHAEEMRRQAEGERQKAEAERQRREALERRVQELERHHQQPQQGGYGAAYQPHLPPPPPNASIPQRGFQRMSTLEAFQMQQHEQQRNPRVQVNFPRSSAAYA